MISVVLEKVKYCFLLLCLALLFYFLDLSCIFRWLFDVPCPSCGMTRSFIALLNFDLKQSIYYHPLLIVMVIFIPALLLCELLGWQKGKLLETRVLFVGVVVLLVVYFYRLHYNMIP